MKTNNNELSLYISNEGNFSGGDVTLFPSNFSRNTQFHAHTNLYTELCNPNNLL